MKNHNSASFRFMTCLSVLFFTLILSPGSRAAAAPAKKQDVAAMVTQIMGKMEFLRAGTAKWQKAKPGMFLYQGDKLKTSGRSKAAIMFSNGAEVKINQNTEFDIESSAAGKSDSVRINRGQGTCSLRAKRGGGISFSVKTPVAVVSIRGTEFDTDVSENGDTTILVVKGVVAFENEFGAVEVKENQTAKATGSGAPSQPEDVKSDDMKKKRDWQEEIKVERKDLVLKLKTETGEEKTLRLKFKK